MKRCCIIGGMGLILSVTAGADQIERMAVVPADTFLMGDGAASRGLDPHSVTLTHDFYLGLYEVTNQEYLEAVQWAHDHGYVTATATAVHDNMGDSNVQLMDLDGECELGFRAGVFWLRDTGHGVNPDHPVKEVTWYGAARFCDWLSLQAGLPRAYEHTGDWSCNGGDPYGAEGYRLPTNAEWEYAARFDEAEVRPRGADVPPCERANCWPGTPRVGWTTPVGSYPAAPAALGLSDMSGNVWEWCQDWWTRSLGSAHQLDPPGPVRGTYRILRGGSWGTEPVIVGRAPQCHQLAPSSSFDKVGFRLARTANPLGIDGSPQPQGCQVAHAANWPNPFMRLTWITYSIPSSTDPSNVLLAVYDIAGRRTRTLVVGEQSAGQHVISWDGTDTEGRPVAGGTYFYRLTVAGRTETRPLILIR